MMATAEELRIKVERLLDLAGHADRSTHAESKADAAIILAALTQAPAVPSDALRSALERLRNIRIPTGRDEHSQDYADGYEAACEMAANLIEEALSRPAEPARAVRVGDLSDEELEAIRTAEPAQGEVTEAMIAAGVEEWDNQSDGTRVTVCRIYRAMQAAAGGGR